MIAPMKILQATVPWTELKLDLALLIAPCVIMVASLVPDIANGDHYWFESSGSVMVACAGWSAYRSLLKHWRKAESRISGGQWVRTSPNQTIIDRRTLAMYIVGTIVWGYGSKIFDCLIR